MKKSILFKLFKLGALPKKIRPVLEQEEILAMDEGVGVRFIAKKLKGPHRRHVHKTGWFPGCLVVTKKRAACFALWNKEIINIPVEKLKPGNFFVKVPRDRELSLSFESSSFFDGWSGMVEFRFKTFKARQFQEALRSLTWSEPRA